MLLAPVSLVFAESLVPTLFALASYALVIEEALASLFFALPPYLLLARRGLTPPFHTLFFLVHAYHRCTLCTQLCNDGADQAPALIPRVSYELVLADARRVLGLPADTMRCSTSEFPQRAAAAWPCSLLCICYRCSA